MYDSVESGGQTRDDTMDREYRGHLRSAPRLRRLYRTLSLVCFKIPLPVPRRDAKSLLTRCLGAYPHEERAPCLQRKHSSFLQRQLEDW